jgi:molybdate transport system ATP-binding protein
VSLFVDVRQTFSSLQLDVRLELGNGLTALVGSSGSGKTTLLNIVAGVMRPERALVRVDKDVLADTAAGIWRPAYRRRIGYVFQEPRLFPHLTVRQNLLYGRWFRRGVSTDIAPDEVIGLLNLGPLLQRRPAKLSGGEKQRVALGRALLAAPRLLLLDEPLASVDREHRAEILPFLDRIRAEHALPAIYVTHTWSEVAGRADHVVHLRDGAVSFSGSVTEFNHKPDGIEP